MASRPPPEETASEEEQQQMERFYALLANVRAMRAMFKEAALPNCVVDGGNCREQQQRNKKRPRVETPWQPAFEMADFECDGGGSMSSTESAKATKGVKQDDDGYNCEKKGKVSAANYAAADEDDGEVVEGKPVAVVAGNGAGRAVDDDDRQELTAGPTDGA
uniref:Uncharacterized protein n=1 Tax=Leersia perrieri TaxID=77586 RepID=A0A0D9V1F2_9ORYZ